MGGSSVKLLYAIASALFCVTAPVAAPAQSFDLSLMSALCSDDYYEDTAGQCGAIFAIEAILANYEVIITDSDDAVIVLYLDDLEDMPVGAIQPRNEDAVSTDEKSNAEPISEPDTIPSTVITVGPCIELGLTTRTMLQRPLQPRGASWQPPNLSRRDEGLARC